MATTQVAGGSQVPLPEEYPLAADRHDSGELAAEVADGGARGRERAERDPDQWWYWTPEWQEGERQIERDRAAGLSGPVFHSGDEFLGALRSRAGRTEEPDFERTDGC